MKGLPLAFVFLSAGLCAAAPGESHGTLSPPASALLYISQATGPSAVAPPEFVRYLSGRIVATKVFAVAVAPTIADMVFEKQSPKLLSLQDFLVTFGGSKKKSDALMEYANVMSRLKVKWRRGLGKYLIERLDAGVVRGGGIVQITRRTTQYNPSVSLGPRSKWFVKLDYKALGFTAEPGIITSLRMDVSDFLLRFQVRHTSQATEGKRTRKALIKRDDAKQYTAFVTRAKAARQYAIDMELNYVTMSAARFARKVEEEHYGSLNAITKRRSREDRVAALFVLPVAGMLGAQKAVQQSHFHAVPIKAIERAAKHSVKVYAIRKYHQGKHRKHRMLKVLSKACRQKEPICQGVRGRNKVKKLWHDQQERAYIARLQRQYESGITVRIRTGRMHNALSSQTPKLTFIGTHGISPTYQLGSVPAVGKTAYETFTPKKCQKNVVRCGIGVIKAVEMVATSQDEWLMDRLDIRIGRYGRWRRFQAKRWLDAKPYNTARRSYGAFPWHSSWMLKPIRDRRTQKVAVVPMEDVEDKEEEASLTNSEEPTIGMLVLESSIGNNQASDIVREQEEMELVDSMGTIQEAQGDHLDNVVEEAKQSKQLSDLRV